MLVGFAAFWRCWLIWQMVGAGRWCRWVCCLVGDVGGFGVWLVTLMICRVVGDVGWFCVWLVMCPGFGDWFGNAC